MLVAAAVILSACASGSGTLDSAGTFLPPAHRAARHAAPICCTSYAQLPFGPLAIDQDQPFALTPQSPVYEFPSGRSFFQAFELPLGARSVVVKSNPVNTLYNPAAHVLLPGLVFLSASHEVLSRSEPDYAARRPAVIGSSWAEATVGIPPGARYVVIVSNDEARGLEWRDSDQRSGSLFIRSGPTGMGTLRAITAFTPIDEAAAGQVATIGDNTGKADSVKTELFYVKAIDGKPVNRTSLEATRDATRNRGLHLLTRYVTHRVPARPVIVTLVATHITAAPIQEIGARMSGQFVTIEGDVRFEPKPGVDYLLNGDLTPGKSYVCIADATDGHCVSEAVRK